MLRLGRPVGAYPRLEARLAAIHLGSRDEEEERTGCAECGGSKDATYDEPCSKKKGDDVDDEDDCPCSDDGTEKAESDCGCDQ